MLRWLRQRRRRRLKSAAFPASWTEILRRNAPFPARQTPSLHQKYCDVIQVLVAEKNWEGCGGLSLTDEHRVTIAGHAARMALGFEDEYFDDVTSILVYPSAYEARTQQVLGPGVVIEGAAGRVGEAWYRGPIIVSWSDVMRIAHCRHHGRNVILHEFAHLLDTRNGRVADGIPMIESRSLAERWQAVSARDYARLCELCRNGQSNLLDCYAASSSAEFFAVASEAFFERPADLAVAWPDYFELLAQFYQQVPA